MSQGLLTADLVETILQRLPSLRLAVIGDLFLDRYLDLDGSLTEPSLETGLDAYQVVGVRSIPGAAGTILNNLVALGVGTVSILSVIGNDGEGYELSRALQQMPAVDTHWLLKTDDRRTPTYTKPMLKQPGEPARELNRTDIKNRTIAPPAAEAFILQALAEAWPRIDALLVLDQVSERDCGVITERVRQLLAQLGQSNPEKLMLADSRERIGEFRFVSAKPNQNECLQAVAVPVHGTKKLRDGVQMLAERLQRPVFCTCGDKGILVADPNCAGEPSLVPAYPVEGPIDVVGAGDSTSAAIASAVAAGAGWLEAAAFGNLVASITIQQIGTTGTASPEQIRQRIQSCGAL